MEFTAEMISGFLNGEIVGDKSVKVWTVSKIEEGVEGSISFLSNPKYEQYVYGSDSSIIIVNRDFEPSAPVKSTIIKVDDAYSCFAKLLELYVANKPRKSGISAHAVVSDSATIGEVAYIGEFAVVGDGAKIGSSARIYPHVYIGDNVVVGDNVVLHSGVKVYEECVLGSNIIIHAGTVIGGDGFGFAPNAQGEFSKIPQIGNVIIEDDVEIGANTCIDRATMGSTIIRRGVKLDNLIQIGHNVVVGENTVCAAQTGIAGSTKVGHNCMMAGQVGIAGHLTIGDNVTLGSKAGATNNIDSNEIHLGYPSLPVSKFHRSNAVFRNLPELSSDVHNLKKQVKKLLEEK